MARTLTVRTYVLGGFAACVALVGALVWFATDAAVERERARASSELRAGAEAGAAWLDPAASSVESLLASFAADPNVASMDPARCQPVFDALIGGVMGAHIHVLDAAGDEVCGLRPPEEGIDTDPLPRGEWADRAVAEGGVVFTDPLPDPLSPRPASIWAMPVGDDGAVIAVVLYTGEPAPEVPGLRDEIGIVALDPEMERVIAVAGVEGVEVGDPASVVLDDGDRYVEEAVVPTIGWHVLATVDADVALASAHEQRRWMLGIGAAIVGTVLLLGVLLLLGVARPLRRFGAAVGRSRAGDDTARADERGPAELVDAARLFNELIADRNDREAVLHDRATHDALTGLPNRAALVEALQSVAAGGEPCAVLFLDLDRFKIVNDVHGHAVGDQLLFVLAGELAAAVGEGVLLARFGGDEFVAVCRGVSQVADAEVIALRILDVVCAPIVVGDDIELFVTGSVGVALSRPGDTADDLLRNADTAMYRSKAAGAGGFDVFDAAMREWMVQRLAIEHDLHRAIERDELVLHYQPIIVTGETGVRRVEALVRWQHPERGLLPPGDFISVAEEAGLIARLGEVVLTKATAMAASTTDVHVSVNVSPAQLAGGLVVDQVRRALAVSGLAPQRLTVEITETGLLDDLDAVAAVLAQVRALGVEVALDDFGTGWSSLSWLQTLPVDEVKVDRSFVAGLGEDETSSAIVRAVAELSGTLGLRVVAEGVETAEQLAEVRRLGITGAQGYLFGRPVPADQLAAVALGT